jgi:hypothetical protein
LAAVVTTTTTMTADSFFSWCHHTCSSSVLYGAPENSTAGTRKKIEKWETTTPEN